MAVRVTGASGGRSYLGVRALTPPNYVSIPRNPTIRDYLTFKIGDIWLNNNRSDAVNYESVWMYVAQDGNVATWIRFANGSGNLQTLTGDVGGAVFPLANNINVNGLNGIVTTGNIAPASPHQLTIGSSSGHTFVQSVEGDDLVKVFADSTGNINTRGGIILPNVLANIETFGNAGTFTEFFALKNSILQPNTSADGTQGVYALGSTGYVHDRFLHNYGTANTFCGQQAGNMTLTVLDAVNNCGFGTGALIQVTTGDANNFFGINGGTTMTSGSTNNGFGAGAINLATTGSGNCGFGHVTLTNLVSGNNNCAFGTSTGTAYTTNESGNINFGANALGQAGENNILRIRNPSNVGDNNIFIGQEAGNNTYTIGVAGANTGVGSVVFQNLSTGTANGAFGAGALTALNTGSNNWAFGGLGMLTTGNQNTSVSGALPSLVTGSFNIAVGYHAGLNYTGAESSNITIGTGANSAGQTGENGIIRIVTTAAGDNNIFIGANSGNLLYTIGTANQNTAVGAGSLSSLTTASACAAFGQGALQGVTTANHCTAMGFGTLTNCTTSAENVAMGTNALNDLTTGTGRNTAIGTAAGDALLTGQNNLYLGFNAGINNTSSESSNIYILSFGVAAESNTIRIGNPGSGAGQQNRCFVYGVRGVTTGNADAVAVLVDSAGQFGTVSSSIRYKTDIRDMTHESEGIYNLKPVKFKWREDKAGRDNYGLIAEDVDKLFPYLTAYDENEEPYSVKYHELPVLLLNEIKKLRKEIDILKSKIE